LSPASPGSGLSDGPAGPGPVETEARLCRIATTTTTPIFYLGPGFHGWPLDDAIVFSGGTEAVGDDSLDPGQSIAVGYGSYCSGDSCGWRVEVGAQDIPLSSTVGCSRLAPIHGVPTVALSDAVILFTGDLAIRVGTTPGDVKLATKAANQLRQVGETAAVGSLPPPPLSKVKLIDTACGGGPGEHGPGRDVEPEPLPAGLPDFTVPRLGGGQLRWADYAGRPVIAVAGDITQVAPALRRLARLTDGGKSPAVIGLAWDPYGAKGDPAPADEIRRKAGVLPVPVGYPATYPAVWLSDSAGVGPGDVGIIGFLDRKGIPVTLLRSSASDTQIRAAIKQLL
jgi:hypothetical protein